MWSLPFEVVDMAVTAGNTDTCFSGVEELDTVRLLLQPVQLGLTNYIVHDKYCSCASPTHWLQLLYCFHGCVCSPSSEQLYNSRCMGFHVETCKHVNPIIRHNDTVFHATIMKFPSN